MNNPKQSNFSAPSRKPLAHFIIPSKVTLRILEVEKKQKRIRYLKINSFDCKPCQESLTMTREITKKIADKNVDH